jgi:hypothetical protein
MPAGKRWHALQFSSADLEHHLDDCAHQVTRRVRELGGISYSTEQKR